jgi:ATP/maltotriose-dependent transcriptional regulator MalT
VPAGELVGRAADIEVLELALGRLRRGYGSALVVLGEPGIGKTRFLSEIRSRAGLGEVVLSGSASEYEAAIPYGVFVAALDDYLQTVDPELLDSLDDDVHLALAEMLPSYPVSRTPTTPRPLDPRYQAHRAMRALLQRLATSKPHIIVLDDLHWADAATIGTVGALLRRPPSGPVLALLATRTRQAPTLMLSAVDDAVRSGTADRLDLVPLTEDESRQLLTPDFSDEQATALHAASRGNPFYIEQLARITTTTQPGAIDIAVSGGSADDLPPLVAAALTGEIDTLTPEARHFLQGAAVTGDPFEAELATTTAGLVDAAVADALDELLERDLIRHTDVPRRFRFRHPLLRRAVYETTPGGWRLAAHERCAAALAARGASALVLAGHFEHAGRHGDQHAVDILTQAGTDLAARAPIDAARYLSAALRLAPPDQTVKLGTQLARAYASGGRFADAHRVCTDTLTDVARDDVDAYLQLAGLGADMENMLGRHTEAHARLTTALARLPASPTPHGINLLTQLSVDSFYTFDLRAMGSWARRAWGAATVLSDNLKVVQTASLCATAAALDGQSDEARAIRAEVREVADSLTDDDVAREPNYFSVLAVAEYYLDLYQSASAHAERGLAVARSVGRGELIPVLYWTGVIRAAQGQLVRALSVLDTAVEIARIAEHDTGVAWNLSARSLAASAVGDLSGALAAAQEAVALTRANSSNLPAVMATLANASVLFDAGIPDQALAQIEACRGGQGPSSLPARWQPNAYELTTRCNIELTRPDEAARCAALAGQAAEHLDLPTASAAADRATAVVALALDDPDTAYEHAQRALDALGPLGAALEAERTRLLVGQALAAIGRTAEAIEQLNTAASRSDAASAHLLRHQAEREMRKLGRRRHRRSAPAPHDGTAFATLTGREREIADLVADGKTYPQIAAELYISIKTVETHLRNVFHKLHVRSRLELARLADAEDVSSSAEV